MHNRPTASPRTATKSRMGDRRPAMNLRLLSTAEAADLLGISRQRIHQLIAAGTLHAQRVGPGFVIQQADVEAIRVRYADRPSKASHARTERRG